MPKHRELDHDFFEKWSPEMSYVLGFFAADGSMLKNGRGAHFIEFTITDREILEYIQQVTASTHRISTREARGNRKIAYRLQIGSKKWFTDLVRLGFTQNKSKVLPLPKIPKKYFADFVRGYFDGDGCVYFSRLQFADRKNPRWALLTLFTSGCRPFLLSLWDELKMRGINGGSLKKKTRGFELVFSHADSVALYRLMYHTAKVASFSLKRKREKLEEAIQVLGLDIKMRG